LLAGLLKGFASSDELAVPQSVLFENPFSLIGFDIVSIIYEHVF